MYEQETGKKVSQLCADAFRGDSTQKGTLFEFYIFKQLYKLKGMHKFMFNLILPTDKGTTEIDVLIYMRQEYMSMNAKTMVGRYMAMRNTEYKTDCSL